MLVVVVSVLTVWLNVPQLELVFAQFSNTNIVLFAFIPKFVLNGRMVKSAAYSSACRILASPLQLATFVWVCTSWSLLVMCFCRS